ncbi:hypothetical protein NHX12_028622 [Muraenolepis orangiensis]|uniref:Uncharacterized protein n=1 Tax=Muraenolepis orangiensis TaxID=630683 RepID=A0A9Q0INZ7_9TELE|nr:hypothetical protein NHX12_028622 [Muraenolepis orangiensis]
MVETLSIAVIGAPGVGKTSIIRQFVFNDFSEVYKPTRTRYVYRPSVILNGNMYELNILDVPPITSFPSSSSQRASVAVFRSSSTALDDKENPDDNAMFYI